MKNDYLVGLSTRVPALVKKTLKAEAKKTGMTLSAYVAFLLGAKV